MRYEWIPKRKLSAYIMNRPRPSDHIIAWELSRSFRSVFPSFGRVIQTILFPAKQRAPMRTTVSPARISRRLHEILSSHYMLPFFFLHVRFVSSWPLRVAESFFTDALQIHIPKSGTNDRFNVEPVIETLSRSFLFRRLSLSSNLKGIPDPWNLLLATILTCMKILTIPHSFARRLF